METIKEIPQEYRDEKLQTLLNSLITYSVISPAQREINRNFEKWSRWKIYSQIPHLKPYKGKNVTEMVPNPKYAYVEPVLKNMYRFEVETRGMKYENDMDPYIYTQIVSFLTEENTPFGLLLCGTPGNGKTTYMKAIHSMIRKFYENDTVKPNTLFIKASELGEYVKNDYETFKKIRNTAVLFIDDIGFSGEAETVNDYGVKRQPVIDIFEHRYDKMLMTICSTNLTLEELKERYGERIFSRMHEMFMILNFTSCDYRKKSWFDKNKIL